MKTNEEYRLLEQQLASTQDEINVEEKRFNDLSDDYAEALKQNVMLRDALKHNLNAPRDPNAVDDGFAALAATADLAGLVVCDAVPVARFNWNEGKFEWLTKYDYYKHHLKQLYIAKEKS
jgi:hypothetical protein